MIVRHALAVIAASAIAVSAFAQSGATINVHVMELPVTVIDGSGNPVRGLTAANFILYDEKTKQSITSFDAIDFAARDAVNAISPLNAAARRSFVLVFDLGFTSPRSMSRSQEAARGFVSESVGPRDRIAVVTVDPDRGFRFVTAFTTDRELVAAAISNPTNFRGTDPLQLANQTAIWSAGAPIGAELPMPTPADLGDHSAAAVRQVWADEQKLDLAASAVARNLPSVRQRIERELDTLSSLARALRAVPGRKQAVFLSEGFDASHLQGNDARDTKGQQERNDQIMFGDLSRIDNDKVFGTASSMVVLNRMAESFRASDVVLQAIDIQGVRVQNNLGEGSVVNSNASLFLLALRWGPEGVAAAWSISFWTLLIPGFWYAGHPVGFRVSDFTTAIWRYAAAALAAGLTTAAIMRGTSFWDGPSNTGAALAATVIISTLFVTIYVGTIILFHWGLAPLRQLTSLLRELAPAPKDTKPAAKAVGACE